MVLQKVQSILLHSIASTGVLAPLGKLDNLMAFDNAEETRQMQNHREAQRRKTLRRITALQNLDANQLPLVATDRLTFERALLEAGSTANPSKSHARNNGSSSKQKIHSATEMCLEPWIHNVFAAEFRLNLNKETI